MTTKTKNKMRVISNLGEDQELHVDPNALVSFLKPNIEKFLARKNDMKKAECNDSATSNTRH